MLIYEYRVREEFLSLREYAELMKAKFERGEDPGGLLLDAKSLDAQYDRLNQMLPEEVRGTGQLGRHIHFLEYWLERGDRESCQSDIVDICERDITELENAFHLWGKRPDHFDSELTRAISDLLAQLELDSAIRKAFVVLKERLCKRFRVSRDLDGVELINTIFGSKSEVTELSSSERQAVRDLLAGMYGVFRNRFVHSDTEPSWAEADAILSMINYVLLEVGQMK